MGEPCNLVRLTIVFAFFFHFHGDIYIFMVPFTLFRKIYLNWSFPQWYWFRLIFGLNFWMILLLFFRLNFWMILLLFFVWEMIPKNDFHKQITSNLNAFSLWGANQADQSDNSLFSIDFSSHKPFFFHYRDLSIFESR